MAQRTLETDMQRILKLTEVRTDLPTLQRRLLSVIEKIARSALQTPGREMRHSRSYEKARAVAAHRCY